VASGTEKIKSKIKIKIKRTAGRQFQRPTKNGRRIAAPPVSIASLTDQRCSIVAPGAADVVDAELVRVAGPIGGRAEPSGASGAAGEARS